MMAFFEMLVFLKIYALQILNFNLLNMKHFKIKLFDLLKINFKTKSLFFSRNN